MLNLWKSY